MTHGIQTSDVEYSECWICDGLIQRLRGGMWEHTMDYRIDDDHVTQPAPEPVQLSFDEVRDRMIEAYNGDPDWGGSSTITPKQRFL